MNKSLINAYASKVVHDKNTYVFIFNYVEPRQRYVYLLLTQFLIDDVLGLCIYRLRKYLLFFLK